MSYPKFKNINPFKAHEEEIDNLTNTLKDILNGLYALRDHAQEQGLEATLEQSLINKAISAIGKTE